MSLICPSSAHPALTVGSGNAPRGLELLKKSEVYIFDEFTSSLDNLTEKKILDNLKELSKTMIFVAHKKEVMDICDTIYDLSSK